MMSGLHTLEKKFWNGSFEADRRGQALPSLVPVTAPEIKVA